MNKLFFYSLIIFCFNFCNKNVTKIGKKNTKNIDSITMNNDINNLTQLQKDVAFKNATERPFENEFWDHKEQGIYVDIISKKPLFVSTHKFDSGSGWPSFFNTIDDNEIIKVSDKSLGMTRIEVRSKTSNIHLGHVFSDGPFEKNDPLKKGLRYCINSAVLEFIPLDKMKSSGYGEHLILFKTDDVQGGKTDS